ncbi:hypothetical protein NMG60_11024667 [Bertholletia excelsa]
MDASIEEEIMEQRELPEKNRTPASVIDIASSDSNSDSDFDIHSSDDKGVLGKKRKLDCVLPVGFLDPLPSRKLITSKAVVAANACSALVDQTMSVEKAVGAPQSVAVVQGCKQFWKAGEYEGVHGDCSASHSVGMDHLRVHPKFLHSNATSHKWALGAFAELLDNALDEVCHGATYVHVDVLRNKKDKTHMLVVEDNGGGMTPNIMRQCMSLGYSVKSKLANTIGQYGNGFKTSTMRIGADVIVFSRHSAAGTSLTQSIGMLSYTFLRQTGKEDIVVPIIDYERRGEGWSMLLRSSHYDWTRNLETILQWSPYSSEEDLLQQFNALKDQGTGIIIYNLWEDDQGQPELDFETDKNDIQIRGVNRDEKKIGMAKIYPNSRHYLTYQHSLRSYASILYLRIPPGFRIILRGKDVDHHDLANDMMLAKKMVAIATIGFVKDAQHHIDIQGFNVYHKNRLIKPFWRVWNAAGSDGRGVIGVLEANFVEPAHDKQGFERTIALARLEARLLVMQKNYWSSNCHKIGYAPRRHSKTSVSPDKECTPPGKDKPSLKKFSPDKERTLPGKDKPSLKEFSSDKECTPPGKHNLSLKEFSPDKECTPPGKDKSSLKKSVSAYGERTLPDKDKSCSHLNSNSHFQDDGGSKKSSRKVVKRLGGKSDRIARCLKLKVAETNEDEHACARANTEIITKLEKENHELRKRLEKGGGTKMAVLLHDLQSEKERCKSLENKLQEAQQKIEALDKEQEAFIDIFSEERSRRDAEEESLRQRLKDASTTIQKLLDKVKLLESRKVLSCKVERP